MRLFIVRVETEVVVVAEDEADAVKQAGRDWRDITDEYSCDVTAREMTYLTNDADEIPFGRRDENDPDRTIQGWIDAGAAPKLKKRP